MNAADFIDKILTPLGLGVVMFFVIRRGSMFNAMPNSNLWAGGMAILVVLGYLALKWLWPGPLRS